MTFKNILRTTAKIWCISRTIPEPKEFKRVATLDGVTRKEAQKD